VSFTALHNACRSRWDAQVATPLSLPTLYDNAPEPAGGQPTDARWARFIVRPGERFHSQMGGPTNDYRTPGMCVAQLFAPLEEGDGYLLEIVDSIDAAFRAVTVGGIVFQVPYTSFRGRMADSDWWQINVVCPFIYDETLTP